MFGSTGVIAKPQIMQKLDEIYNILCKNKTESGVENAWKLMMK